MKRHTTTWFCDFCPRTVVDDDGPPRGWASLSDDTHACNGCLWKRFGAPMPNEDTVRDVIDACKYAAPEYLEEKLREILGVRPKSPPFEEHVLIPPEPPSPAQPDDDVPF